MEQSITAVNPDGSVLLSAAQRERFGITPGDTVIAEQTERGILIRPVASPDDGMIETYTPERQAEFLLSNAVDDDDYARAVAAVRAMGLDPDAILRLKPGE